MGECLTGSQEVRGSNPLVSTKKDPTTLTVVGFSLFVDIFLKICFGGCSVAMCTMCILFSEFIEISGLIIVR